MDFIFCIKQHIDGRLAYKVVAHGTFDDLEAAIEWAQGAGKVLEPELQGSHYVYVLPEADGFTCVRVDEPAVARA